MSADLRTAVAIFLLILFGATVPVLADSAVHDPARVRWSELSLRASKLTVTATSKVEIRTEPVARVARHWLQPPGLRGILPRGPEVVRVSVGSKVLSKTSKLDLWLDPGSAAAVQRTQLEIGRKVRHNRHRSLRFTDRGVFNSTYRANEETVGRPFAEWALTEELQEFPGSVGGQGVVTEPSALFYLLATADLIDKGDEIDTLVFSKGRVQRVSLTAVGTTEIKVAYVEVSDHGEKKIQGRQQVVRIRLEGTPVGGGSDTDFEFLGLRGDVEIFLEPTRRIPVQISGKIRFVGKGHVRLQRVRLRSEDVTRSSASGAESARPKEGTAGSQ